MTRLRVIGLLASAAAALALPIGASGTTVVAPNFAGTGDSGYSGDGGPAHDAELHSPRSIAPAPRGDGYLIADTDNNSIRKVAADGTITTVAGTGTRGFSGDGGPATAAELDRPPGVAATADGGFLIADAGNNRVRKVCPLRRHDHHGRRHRQRGLRRRRRRRHARPQLNSPDRRRRRPPTAAS